MRAWGEARPDRARSRSRGWQRAHVGRVLRRADGEEVASAFLSAQQKERAQARAAAVELCVSPCKAEPCHRAEKRAALWLAGRRPGRYRMADVLGL